ncbi:hypothetical protein ACHWQZ_G004502 [Mnemiopsis leidyi]
MVTVSLVLRDKSLNHITCQSGLVSDIKRESPVNSLSVNFEGHPIRSPHLTCSRSNLQTPGPDTAPENTTKISVNYRNKVKSRNLGRHYPQLTSRPSSLYTVPPYCISSNRATTGLTATAHNLDYRRHHDSNQDTVTIQPAHQQGMIISTSSTILDYPGVSHHSNTRKPAPYTRPLQNETSSVNRTYETREALYKETHFNYEHASPSKIDEFPQKWTTLITSALQ